MRFDEGFDADTQVTMSWGEPERMFIARELPPLDEDSGSEYERWEREEQDVTQHRFEELLRVYGQDMARRIFLFEHDQVGTYPFCSSRIVIADDPGHRLVARRIGSIS